VQIVLLVAHVTERFLIVLFEDRLNACYPLLIGMKYLCQRLLAKSADKTLGMIALSESGNTFTIYGLLTNGTRAPLNLRLGKSLI
jgi:hypothetical protein